MIIDACLKFLKHPDSDAECDFFIEGNLLVDIISNRSYPLIHNMIDFEGDLMPDKSSKKNGLLFKLNLFYGNHLDPWLRTSIFAGGGVGFINTSHKMKQWIDKFAAGVTLFIEPEDDRLISYIGREKCLTVEDFNFKNVYPLESDYPNLNASPENMPIKSNSFQNIISNFVLEHLVDPRRHMAELARILKPGGYAILEGPGDVYPSHRVPYNYFNIIRYGYLEMFKENKLELVEEYFPFRSWMSILYIIQNITVRNNWFNKNQLTKLCQLVALGISIILMPIFNLLALLLDLVTPFDKRVYSVYMALLRKPGVHLAE